MKKLLYKNYSFKNKLRSFFYLFFALTMLGMIIFSGYFSYSLRQRTYSDVNQLLSLYNEQTSQDLKNVDFYLMEINSYSQDISTVSVMYDVSKNYANIIRISNLFEFNLRSFQSITGMYAYFPRSDTWIAYSGNSESRREYQEALKNQFHSGEILKDVEDVNGLRWLPYNFEGNTYLVKAFKYDNSIVGAWTNLDALSSSLDALDEMDAIIFFSDSDGKTIHAKSTVSNDRYSEILSDYTSIVLPIDSSLNGATTVSINGTKYLITTSKLSYCDYYISALVPMATINHSLINFWKFAFAIMFIAIICFSVIIVLFNHFVDSTITMLDSMSDSVIAGNLEGRIDISNENCIEIRKVADSYNSMLDNIQKLKLDVYEERIQKKNFQLYFLKSQVAPHFLINCLNMISYLADGTEENTKILKTMITTLSSHLRYTLTTKDNVPLYKEIEYLNNYVELTKLRFPNCITYETDFDEAAMNAGVFPILLIGFVENAFKHNLIMGETFTLKCSSKRYVENNEERLHFTIIDSGEGYSEDFLDDFYNNNIKDNERIGIKNVENRLKLYYDDSASMKLSNEDGMGARTDIDIPYIEYK